MFNYSLRRLLMMIPTLFLITAVIFAIVKLAPGNPFSFNQSTGEAAAKRMNPADYQALLKRYGLDKPWYVQYGRWVKNLLRGSFGDSFTERRPVSEVFLGETRVESQEGGKKSFSGWGFLTSPLGATLFLNILALFLVAAIAVPIGIRSATGSGGWFDRLSGWLLYALYALPNFWIAVLLIILFGVTWHLLPFIGMHSDDFASLSFFGKCFDILKHSLLPAVCLAYGGLAFVARFTRGTLLDVMGRDYVRTARAKGLSEKLVIRRHVLRNAMVPLLTLAGLLVPTLVSGSVIIEPIFSWPGLGQMYMKAIYTRDYPIIMAESLLGAVVVLLSMLAVDLAYGWADPRSRVE